MAGQNFDPKTLVKDVTDKAVGKAEQNVGGQALREAGLGNNKDLLAGAREAARPATAQADRAAAAFLEPSSPSGSAPGAVNRPARAPGMITPLDNQVASVQTGVAQAEQAVKAIPDALAEAKADQLQELVRLNKIDKSVPVMKELIAAGRSDLVERAITEALQRNDTQLHNNFSLGSEPGGALNIIKQYREIAGPAIGADAVSASIAKIGENAIYNRISNGYEKENLLKDHAEKIARACFDIDKKAAVDAVQRIASQVVESLYREGHGDKAERMCKSFDIQSDRRTQLAGDLRDIMLDPNYSADDKVALVTSFQMRGNLSRSDMRSLIDEALKGQESMVGGLGRDSAKKLQEELKKVIDKYDGGVVSFDRPGSDFESALKKRVESLAKSEAQRQQAEERAAREAEQKAKQQAAQEAAAKQTTTRAELEGKIGDAMLDLTMSAEDKIAKIQALKSEGKLTDQNLRNIIEKQLDSRAKGLAGTLTLDEIRKLQADMDAMDSKFGVAGVMWENNGFQRDLNRREDVLERAEAQRQQAEERAARDAARTEAGYLLKGLDRDSFDANKGMLAEICKEHGIDQKQLFKQSLAELAAIAKSAPNRAEFESKLFAYGQMAAALGVSPSDVARALEKSGSFSATDVKSIRAMVQAGYTFERE